MANLDRDSARALILGKSHAPKAVTFTFFGADIELRQDTVGDLIEAQKQNAANEVDQSEQLLRILIRRAYLPGTDMKVFDETDVDALKTLPWTGDWAAFSRKIQELDEVNFQPGLPDSSETTGDSASSE